VDDLKSFYVIVGHLGRALDPWPLVGRFLRDVGKPRESSDTGSGS
jgi:hypothetical protein